MRILKKFPALLLGAMILSGCGSSAPEHVVKPLPARPTSPNPFQSFNSPEDKIRYIENSKAPDSVKKSVIARIKAGQL